MRGRTQQRQCRSTAARSASSSVGCSKA
jgi:hypothetical protein